MPPNDTGEDKAWSSSFWKDKKWTETVLFHGSFTAFFLFVSPLPVLFCQGNSKVIPCYWPALDVSSLGCRGQNTDAPALGGTRVPWLPILPVSLWAWNAEGNCNAEGRGRKRKCSRGSYVLLPSLPLAPNIFSSAGHRPDPTQKVHGPLCFHARPAKSAPPRGWYLCSRPPGAEQPPLIQQRVRLSKSSPVSVEHDVTHVTSSVAFCERPPVCCWCLRQFSGVLSLLVPGGRPPPGIALSPWKENYWLG